VFNNWYSTCYYYYYGYSFYLKAKTFLTNVKMSLGNSSVKMCCSRSVMVFYLWHLFIRRVFVKWITTSGNNNNKKLPVNIFFFKDFKCLIRKMSDNKYLFFLYRCIYTYIYIYIFRYMSSSHHKYRGGVRQMCVIFLYIYLIFCATSLSFMRHVDWWTPMSGNHVSHHNGKTSVRWQ